MGQLYKTYRKKFATGGDDWDWTQPMTGAIMYDDGSQGNYMGSVPNTPTTPQQQEQPKTNASSVNVAGLLGMGATMGAEYIDASGKPLGQYENYKAGSQEVKYAGSRALKGAVTGYQVGGIWGAAAGAVIGGVGGYFKGKKIEKNRKEEVGKLNSTYLENVRTSQLYDGYKNQNYFNDTRTANMYATGGSLSNNFKKLSSSTVEVKGPSHKAGGVAVPGTNAEVEGGETIAGDYVFSEQLGFAKLHKPIAKAKGIVEKQPATAVNINTLNTLNKREEGLKATQEFIKRQLNIR